MVRAIGTQLSARLSPPSSSRTRSLARPRSAPHGQASAFSCNKVCSPTATRTPTRTPARTCRLVQVHQLYVYVYVCVLPNRKATGCRCRFHSGGLWSSSQRRRGGAKASSATGLVARATTEADELDDIFGRLRRELGGGVDGADAHAQKEEVEKR